MRGQRHNTMMTGSPPAAKTFVACLALLCASAGTAAPPCQQAELLASDGAPADKFGFSVSASGDVILVGAFGDWHDNVPTGSAYVYRWNGSSWGQESKLVASDGDYFDDFGSSVAVSGDVAVVGAFNDDDFGSSSGSAYVYRWNGSAWGEEQKLLADDGEGGDLFGDAVSLSGDVAVVGASWVEDGSPHCGSAYVFRWNGTSWIQEQKLLASDRAAEDEFGCSVSVHGDVLVAGAEQDDDNGSYSGSAYVFRRNGSSWEEEQKLVPDDGAGGDLFGHSVSVRGDVAVVGASDDSDNGSDSGSAYVFRWNGSTWEQEQKLLADDGAMSDMFGTFVSMGDDVVVVGAMFDDDKGTNSGSAYVFRWNGSSWAQAAKLLASDGEPTDAFGVSVSVSGDVAVVGTTSHGQNGAAYVYQLDCAAPCPWDLDDSDGVGFDDLLRVLAAWGTDPGGPPDFNGDGDVDFADLLALLSNWGACP